MEQTYCFSKQGSVGSVTVYESNAILTAVKSIKLDKIRFLVAINELRALIRFKHKFIVKLIKYNIYNAGDTDNKDITDTKNVILDIYTEYGGVPITEYILNTKLSTNAKTKLKKHIKNAVDYIHSKGYYHGDLSTNNLLINNNGDPIIIDFGQCMLIGEKQICNQTFDVHDPLNRYHGIEADLYSLEIIFYLINNLLLPSLTIKKNIKLKQNLSMHRLSNKKQKTDRTLYIDTYNNKNKPTKIETHHLLAIELDCCFKEISEKIDIEDLLDVSKFILRKNTKIDSIKCFDFLEKIQFKYFNYFMCFTDQMCETYCKLLYITETKNEDIYFLVLTTSIVEKLVNREFNFNTYLKDILNSDYSMKDFYKILNLLKPHILELIKIDIDSPLDLYHILVS